MANQISDAQDRFWRPNGEVTSTLFTSARELANLSPKSDYQRTTGLTGELTLSLKAPKKYSKETKDYHYADFVQEVMLYYVANNTGPAHWTDGFLALLDGHAKKHAKALRAANTRLALSNA